MVYKCYFAIVKEHSYNMVQFITVYIYTERKEIEIKKRSSETYLIN